MSHRSTVAAVAFLVLMLTGCNGGAPHLEKRDAQETSNQASSGKQRCRPDMLPNRMDRTPPNPTIRSCLCADAPTIRTVDDIKGARPYFLSSRNWNDAYICEGDLHLVYGNVAVDFEDVPGLRKRDVAVWAMRRKAHDWGGHATRFQGYPACVVPPHLDEGAVGEVLIMVNGLMIRVIGNPAASADDLVALAKTFNLSAGPIRRTAAS